MDVESQAILLEDFQTIKSSLSELPQPDDLEAGVSRIRFHAAAVSESKRTTNRPLTSAHRNELLCHIACLDALVAQFPGDTLTPKGYSKAALHERFQHDALDLLAEEAELWAAEHASELTALSKMAGILEKIEWSPLGWRLLYTAALISIVANVAAPMLAPTVLHTRFGQDPVHIELDSGDTPPSPQNSDQRYVDSTPAIDPVFPEDPDVVGSADVEWDAEEPEPDIQAIDMTVPEASSVLLEQDLLKNIDRDKVWNQRCFWTRDKIGKIIGKTCMEAWAASPLPGGCPGDPLREDLFTASCNLAATTFTLNQLVSPDEFVKIIGKPGMNPEILVNDIYPNLPDGKGVRMTCKGAGSEVIIPALKLFGLRVRQVNISEYSLPGLIQNLRSDQRLMVSLIGKNSWVGTPSFKHWTVASGVTPHQGRLVPMWHDSFYYLDPLHPNYDTVIFEESSDMLSDESYIGKAITYVGALVVSKPIQSELPFIEMNDGTLKLGINLLPPEAKTMLEHGQYVVAAYANGLVGWHGQGSIADLFTGFHDFPGKPWYHGKGYDLRLEYGKPFHHSTAVLPGPEMVIATGNMPDGYGNYVIVRNEATGIDILYAHLGKVLVSVGQEVEADTEIGTTDQTGYGATAGPHGGPHVHMEVWFDGASSMFDWENRWDQWP